MFEEYRSIILSEATPQPTTPLPTSKDVNKAFVNIGSATGQWLGKMGRDTVNSNLFKKIKSHIQSQKKSAKTAQPTTSSDTPKAQQSKHPNTLDLTNQSLERAGQFVSTEGSPSSITQQGSTTLKAPPAAQTPTSSDTLKAQLAAQRLYYRSDTPPQDTSKEQQSKHPNTLDLTDQSLEREIQSAPLVSTGKPPNPTPSTDTTLPQGQKGVKKKLDGMFQGFPAGTAGASAAAAAGVLGLWWLYKKMTNGDEITDEDMERARRLNRKRSL